MWPGRDEGDGTAGQHPRQASRHEVVEVPDHRLGKRRVHARVPRANPGSDGADHVDGRQRPGCGLEDVEDLLLDARDERLALVDELGDRNATFDDGVMRTEEPLGIEPPESRAALQVVGRIPIRRCERGVALRVRFEAELGVRCQSRGPLCTGTSSRTAASSKTVRPIES